MDVERAGRRFSLVRPASTDELIAFGAAAMATELGNFDSNAISDVVRRHRGHELLEEIQAALGTKEAKPGFKVRNRAVERIATYLKDTHLKPAESQNGSHGQLHAFLNTFGVGFELSPGEYRVAGQEIALALHKHLAG